MGKKWTDESARSYVAKVQAGKNQIGLTYCSAMDYLVNHAAPPKIEKHPLAEKDETEVVTKKKKNGHNKSNR